MGGAACVDHYDLKWDGNHVTKGTTMATRATDGSGKLSAFLKPCGDECHLRTVPNTGCPG